MKKTELYELTTRKELNDAIKSKFSEWDTIYMYGSGFGFVSDGFILNGLRNDILQMRNKRDRLFPQEIAGQLCMEGFEILPERETPSLLPFNWMAPYSSKTRLANLNRQMAKILSS